MYFPLFIYFLRILCTLIVSPFLQGNAFNTKFSSQFSGHFPSKDSNLPGMMILAQKRGNPMSKNLSKWSRKIWQRESAVNTSTTKGATTQLQTRTTNNNTANWKKKLLLWSKLFFTQKSVLSHQLSSHILLKQRLI